MASVVALHLFSIWAFFKNSEYWTQPPLIFRIGNGGDETIALLLWALALTVTYRLIQSFRYYLRFRHAIATILASQFILFLLLACVYLNWDRF